jgi:hypothetical protein
MFPLSKEAQIILGGWKIPRVETFGRQQGMLQEAHPSVSVMSEYLHLCVSVWARGTRENGGRLSGSVEVCVCVYVCCVHVFANMPVSIMLKNL